MPSATIDLVELAADMHGLSKEECQKRILLKPTILEGRLILETSERESEEGRSGGETI